ncbi:hypothetical protein BFO_1998 [Tannerella forsythia 92A2]|uniref:Uncharacterized protein n=1 Tax=Tannerella forsythia (strain ATCC 43037 / JCM 10827 / CCUG 21028 A / KCTC 5666 / FDC 338) TaxID=203275 RepID=G8UQ71_TANFA|nr:hypothetical protein BFO_1998 [Tannerella forsythia 92A2]
MVHGIRTHHPLSFRTPPFVIPNIVRNLASNALGVRPSASGGEPTEQ